MWATEEEAGKQRQRTKGNAEAKRKTLLKSGSPDGTERIDAAEWARVKLGLEPDRRQEQVLASESARGLLNCCRQWGKSTITAAKAVHEAYTQAGSLTLVVTPSARQSGEFVRKAAAFLRKLRLRAKGDGDNEISLALPNGSRIVGLPGTEGTIRGFSAVSLLLIDEASRVDNSLYLAVRPMLAVSRGKLWLMSTPFGKRGFFYEAWERGGPEWERIRATAYECPRIDQAFLAEERRTMGERFFEQEYLCEFTDAAGRVFDSEAISRAMSNDIEPLRIA